MPEPIVSPKVLVVEDDPNDAALTVRTLRACGVSGDIAVAQTGIEALIRVIGQDEGVPDLPELVLLDLKLPELSGLEVLKQIRAHPHSRNVPVVVLTGSDDHGDLARSYRLGANGYIRKDADPGRFRESIDRLVVSWLTSPADRPVLLLG